MCSRLQPAQRGREFPNMSDGINEEYTPLTNHPAFFFLFFFIAKSSKFPKVKKNTTSHQPGSPSPKKKNNHGGWSARVRRPAAAAGRAQVGISSMLHAQHSSCPAR